MARGGGRGEYYRNKYGNGGGGGRGGRGGREDRRPNNNNQVSSTLPASELASELRRIHLKNYGCYNDLSRAEYCFGDSFRLKFDRIQGDPYAAPSCLHVTVPSTSANFPTDTFQTSRVRKVALADYLTRVFADNAKQSGADAKTASHGWHGAKGGDIQIDKPGQHVLERTSVIVSDDGGVEARFTLGLPAKGRSICGDWASTILLDIVPDLVQKSLIFSNLNKVHLYNHLTSVEDQDFLRNEIHKKELVGFICNGAVLPRQSGCTDVPMSSSESVKFISPPDLSVEFSLPNRGIVTGLGIKKGITLFVGGGFHGKSTVLKSLEVGIYNHIPGDGREFVVVDPNAVKIRSEDSRSVVSCDISAFIDNLPYGKQTKSFTTGDASGSTSQAANIIEALEVGATTLLIDEDTCATNFMIRDQKMQLLVAKEKEPISPFISKAKSLYEDFGISSILVVGGAGDYFHVADTVIMMDSYVPKNVSKEAKEIAEQYETAGMNKDLYFSKFDGFQEKYPTKDGFVLSHGEKIHVREKSQIQYGEKTIDLKAVEQLVEASQAKLIADIAVYSAKYMTGRRTLNDIVKALDSDLQNSLDVVSPQKRSGFYVRPRKLEIAAALNRIRTATFQQL